MLRVSPAALVICIIVTIMLSCTGCEQEKVPITVVPPPLPVVGKEYEKVDGRTWTEWSIIWWQRVLALPKEKNPLLDSTGAFVAAGQKGNIWMLYDTLEGKVKRQCTIPAGKHLFFPVINTLITCREVEINEVRRDLAEIVNKAGIRQVKLNGQILAVKKEYRLSTPPFRFKLPENSASAEFLELHHKNQLGMVEGYWMMPKPLKPGKHTLEITGKLELDEKKIATHIQYDLTVEEAQAE